MAGSPLPCCPEKLSNNRMKTAACWAEMLPGRVATWAPAECEEARGADLGAPHLCGCAGRPAAEPGASQPRRAAPTQAPSPELEPGWHLCMPRRALLAADSLPPSAELHPHGLLCGTPSDLGRSPRSYRGQSSAPRPAQGPPETSRGPVWSPGASTLQERPVDSAVGFGAPSLGCKHQRC